MQGGVRDGNWLTTYGIRYVDADDQLEYLNASSSWVAFGDTFKMLAEDTLFHTWKLIVDPVNFQYVRFLMDNKEYDLSGIGADKLFAIISPATDLRLRLYSRSGGNDVAYVDDAIFTQNEQI